MPALIRSAIGRGTYPASVSSGACGRGRSARCVGPASTSGLRPSTCPTSASCCAATAASIAGPIATTRQLLSVSRDGQRERARSEPDAHLHLDPADEGLDVGDPTGRLDHVGGRGRHARGVGTETREDGEHRIACEPEDVAAGGDDAVDRGREEPPQQHRHQLGTLGPLGLEPFAQRREAGDVDREDVTHVVRTRVPGYDHGAQQDRHEPRERGPGRHVHQGRTVSPLAIPAICAQAWRYGYEEARHGAQREAPGPPIGDGARHRRRVLQSSRRRGARDYNGGGPGNAIYVLRVSPTIACRDGIHVVFVRELRDRVGRELERRSERPA